MFRSSHNCAAPKALFLPQFYLCGSCVYRPDSEKPTHDWPRAETVLLGGWRLAALQGELSTSSQLPGWASPGSQTSSEPGPAFHAWKQNADRLCFFIEQNIHSTGNKHLCFGKRYPHPYTRTMAHTHV